MIFATPETAFYYSDLVKKQRRDQFIALMFLPVDIREAVIAIYALDIELEHVHHAVKEEMIGHIRYAWWRENLAKMSGSDHPVLKALSQINISIDLLNPLVASYAESFPEMPKDKDMILQGSIRQYLPCSKKAKWEKVSVKISSHRKKYGSKHNSWLLVKLLFT